ncbi:hypothetical protein GGR53DRAFT_491289 [Hypoxylon sp. FL1150]|nr:hypothetical protein GGR53DRAFT_491289 [Hypoxylon sp. FL1150]
MSSRITIPEKWYRPYPYNAGGRDNGGMATRMPNPDQKEVRALIDIMPQLCRTSTNFTHFSTVPLVLNTFNCRSNYVRSRGTWVYVYETLIDPTQTNQKSKNLEFPKDVVADLRTKWSSVALHPNRSKPLTLPRYRFVAWIFQHKTSVGTSVTERRRYIFSLVIWDREINEMQWHDTGVDVKNQQDRWKAVCNWWGSLESNGISRRTGPRLALFGEIIDDRDEDGCHDDYQLLCDGARAIPGKNRSPAYYSTTILPGKVITRLFFRLSTVSAAWRNC